jgi:hypothetical protein
MRASEEKRIEKSASSKLHIQVNLGELCLGWSVFALIGSGFFIQPGLKNGHFL